MEVKVFVDMTQYRQYQFKMLFIFIGMLLGSVFTVFGLMVLFI